MVLELGLSPDYVLDEMRDYEITALLEAGHNRYKQQWEMTRFIMWVHAQTHSRKEIDVKDLLRFPWDRSIQENEEVTEEDIERLKGLAEQFIKEKTNASGFSDKVVFEG